MRLIDGTPIYEGFGQPVRPIAVSFRLYLITDRELAGARGLLATCEAALKAAAERSSRGAVAIQLREKDLEARALFELACAMRELCDRWGARLLVNDRIDVAMAAGADGVHLASDSIGVADARKLLGASRLIGVSTHSPAEVRAAADGGADFVVFSPVFSPISKGIYGPPCGREGLIAACRAASLPVFALGGITAERVAVLAGAGAAGAAAIGAVIGADDPARATGLLLDALANWQ